MRNDSEDVSTGEDEVHTQTQTQSMPRYMQKNMEIERKRREAQAELGSDNEDDSNDGYGQSAYNDGKGIHMAITFTPLDSSKRRRANAKPTTQGFVLYFHEDYWARDWFLKVVQHINREDLWQKSWVCDNRMPDDTDRFIVGYTVPRKVTSEVRIITNDDFKTMVDQAALLDSSKDGARVKIFVTEIEAKDQGGGRGSKDDSGESSDDSDDNSERKKKKKRKTVELSIEEKAQNEIIKKLTIHHSCSDKACPKTPCYVAGAEAAHIHLTHQHLRLWAAAIESKAEGVNVENPPNNKLFDVECSANTSDIATLARCRAAMVSQPSVSGTTVSFAGLAEFLREMRREPTPPPPSAGVRPESRPAPAERSHQKLPPPMALDAFCDYYMLPASLQTKLLAIDIQGPHVLRLVQDHDLRSEGKLTIGELATLRDAEERWVKNGNW